ncbi:uncharacterized protein LOC110182992 [Drosophila serrata]|uniref:uncharacterized protein LOC110182992 n=1 Tax=Drosophila serrata TaxID=7274 RepID=UPI000A1CFFF6|nr:uncharacterized protein LOC110182992 [Drosophila serrata]
MSSVQASAWQVIFTICLTVRWCTTSPVINDGVLQDLKKLNLSQAKLVADNSTIKCSFTPNLCDWQLHLYGGHSFSVPLQPVVDKTIAQKTTTVRETFELTPPGAGPQLFLVAEVEPKPKKEMRRKRKLARQTPFNYLSKHRFILLVLQ